MNKKKIIIISLMILLSSTIAAIPNVLGDTNINKEETVPLQDLSVNITTPEKNYFYLRNMKILPLDNRTFIYGTITINASVSSTEEIDRVELYIDDKLVENFTETPYAYNWSPILSFTHTIKYIAYDSEGNNASDEVVVFKWRLHPALILAGAAIIFNPNFRPLRTPRGYTIIRGLIFNPKTTGTSMTFRAINLHYTKVYPLRTETGVIQFKKCTIATNIPDLQYGMGPLGNFNWIYCRYSGTSLEGPSFFQSRGETTR